MFVALRGEPYLAKRAVGEHGIELRVLLQKQHNKAAAKHFFKRVSHASPVSRKIFTDQLRSYLTAKAEIPELVNVKHVCIKAAAGVNKRAENGRQSTREFERRMRSVRDTKYMQALLSSFGLPRAHFTQK